MSDRTGLRIEDLSITFAGGREAISAISLTVRPGEALGLVGESGSGKSLASRAVLGMIPDGAVATGRIEVDGVSVLDLDPAGLRRLRGSGVAMIFQDPMSSLNPVIPVGEAIAQVVRSHDAAASRGAARERAVGLMERVGIREARQRAGAYPHEFSGGMRQRIMIAMATAAHPRTLMADEPTTALDVLVQAEILALLDRIRREERMGLVLVSHDLAVVASVCDRIAVMYAGEIVEEGATADVLGRPLMPYTVGLLSSSRRGRDRPRLSAIPGMPPPPGERPAHCRFASRCPLVADRCRAGPVPLSEVQGRRVRCVRAQEVPALADAAFAALPDEAAHA